MPKIRQATCRECHILSPTYWMGSLNSGHQENSELTSCRSSKTQVCLETGQLGGSCSACALQEGSLPDRAAEGMKGDSRCMWPEASTWHIVGAHAQQPMSPFPLAAEGLGCGCQTTLVPMPLVLDQTGFGRVTGLRLPSPALYMPH